MISKEWLEQRYVVDLLRVEDIAIEAKCGAANIRRLLKKFGLRRGRSFQRGKPAWNAGLTKDTDERVARSAEAKRGENNPMFGRDAWNSGLKKDTDERVAAISVALTGRDFSEATRERMRQAKLGKSGDQANAWDGGIQYSNGYGVLRITVSGERIYLHRHIAQTILCRALTTNEEVHHIDRNKKNNDPVNLIVLVEGDHNKLHRAIEIGYESREDQISWLKENNIPFEVLNEN